MADKTEVDIWVAGFMSGVATVLVEQIGLDADEANQATTELARTLMTDPAAMLSVEAGIDVITGKAPLGSAPPSITVALDGWK